MTEEQKQEDTSKQEETSKQDQPSVDTSLGGEEKQEETQSSNDTASNDSTEEVEVPEKFKSLVEEVEKMSVLDLAELVKILEKKFGVSAAAPAMMVAGGGGAAAGGGEQAEEKDSFDIELTEAGGNKIAVIKVVREITEMGLKDAKDLVDGAPKVVKEGVKKEEAEEIKKKIEEAGGKVTLK